MKFARIRLETAKVKYKEGATAKPLLNPVYDSNSKPSPTLKNHYRETFYRL